MILTLPASAESVKGTSGQLEGSWDSRISFNIMRKDWVSGPSGRTEQVECDPYILVEVSLHKFFYGQNVFGQVENFGELCRMFIDLLGELFNLEEAKFGDKQHAPLAPGVERCRNREFPLA